MKILFTKSSNIFSKTIRWVFSEKASHVAICFDDRVVFHCDLLGTHLAWLGTFDNTREIVYSIKYDLNLEQQEQIYQNIISQYDEKNYNWPAFFYFFWRATLFKIFGVAMPKDNPWTNNGMLCTEIIKCLNPYVKIPESIEIMTPQSLYFELKEGRV